MLVSEFTADLLEGDEAELTEREGVELRGRSDPVRVFAATARSRERPASPR